MRLGPAVEEILLRDIQKTGQRLKAGNRLRARRPDCRQWSKTRSILFGSHRVGPNTFETDAGLLMAS